MTSLDVLSPLDVAQVFQSVGEYIAIHEPIVDEFGTLVDAELLWWNKGYEDVRVQPVALNSKISESYYDPENALEYARTAWSAGRSVQLFEFTSAKRSQYRPKGAVVVISVLWERVGDLIIEIGNDLSEIRRLEDKLADQRSMVFATERERALVGERERIARNLHDTVIQQIYASSLALNAVATRLEILADEQGGVHEQLQTVVKMVADSMSSLISTIRDEIFDVQRETGRTLRQDIEEVILPIIGPSAIETELHVHIDSLDDAEIVTHVRAVIREAVSNAVRHSRGGKVMIALHRTGDRCLHLVVSDDGIGLPEESQRSSGMKNIVDRAKAVGGSAQFLSGPLGGTTVSWQVPVPEWQS